MPIDIKMSATKPKPPPAPTADIESHYAERLLKAMDLGDLGRDGSWTRRPRGRDAGEPTAWASRDGLWELHVVIEDHGKPGRLPQRVRAFDVSANKYVLLADLLSATGLGQRIALSGPF